MRDIRGVLNVLNTRSEFQCTTLGYTYRWTKLCATAWYLLHSCFLLVLFFVPEDGDEMYLWSISWLPTDYAYWLHTIPEDWTRLNILAEITPLCFSSHWYHVHPEVQCQVVYAHDKMLLNISRNQKKIINLNFYIIPLPCLMQLYIKVNTLCSA